ncbi:MAG: PIG-L deacetylase family protein [Planctomycetota bacterium]
MKALLPQWSRSRRERAVARMEVEIQERVRLVADSELGRDTLVVAPHPDDETLGCGGTIARLRALGARVDVVVCTDGSRSHRHLMPPGELRTRRAEEVVRACAVLGVERAHVHRLGIEDGELAGHEMDAAKAIAEILATGSFQRVVLPFLDDGVADHEAAHRAGISAMTLAHNARGCELWEYPIWLWNRWPFGDDPGYGIAGRLQAWRRHRAAARALRRIDRAVSIEDRLPLKRAALAEHVTQTVRLDGNPDWRVLADVADGAWLRRLLAEKEYFAARS